MVKTQDFRLHFKKYKQIANAISLLNTLFQRWLIMINQD